MYFVFVDEQTGIVLQSFAAEGLPAEEFISLNAVQGRIVLQTEDHVEEGSQYLGEGQGFSGEVLILREKNLLPVKNRQELRAHLETIKAFAARPIGEVLAVE